MYDELTLVVIPDSQLMKLVKSSYCSSITIDDTTYHTTAKTMKTEYGTEWIRLYHFVTLYVRNDKPPQLVLIYMRDYFIVL